jgi:hypothetical protein
MFYGMDGFDADAIASQELAFIWGESLCLLNGNRF